MAHAPSSSFANPVVNWIDQRLPVFTMMQKEYGTFPTPKNFNYFWNFGAIAMFVLVVMIVSGVVLAMHYTANTAYAFNSVERIMRDVNYGWLIRYIHMNGASMFFIAVYIHIFRGFLYGSYKKPRELLWILGVVIFLLMMATAFMGYVLPWGQMSFWGATVITNLFSALPVVGESIVTLLWGGFSVDNPTLNRFFALHFLLPFVIVAVVFLHVAALHVTGSNNPLGIEPKGPQDTLPFHPYYTTKDLFGLSLFLIFFSIFVFFGPNALGHPDNYIPADPLVTPAHIVPEWYFLPFYAILRAVTFNIGLPFTDVVLIDAKLGGVLLMFASILIWCLMPWLDRSPVRSYRFRPIYKWWVLMLAVSFCILMYAGAKPAEGWYILLTQFGTVLYFLFFLGLPVISSIERPLPLPASIAKPVLGGGRMGAAVPAKPMEKA
ncbi:MAG: cytochrome b [Pseudomonadota bacterium]|jgi:ubiquinol-cytochrome c reductase cytochrome b subunit